MPDLSRFVGQKLNLVSKYGTRTSFNVTLMNKCASDAWLVSLSREDVNRSSIEVNREYTIRLEENNVVYVVNVTVNKIAHYPFPHLHLSLSEALKNHTRRKTSRYPVLNSKLALNVMSNESNDVISMVDISSDGAQLVSTNRLGKIDDAFVIAMGMARHDRSFEFSCHVRYVLTEIDAVSRDKFIFRHGVEFNNLNCSSENFLQQLLTESHCHSSDLF